jgi:hypothetical protein
VFDPFLKVLIFSLLAHCMVNHECHGFGSEEIFKQFPNAYFIESGSFVGNGIQQAINTGCFQTIHSIELSVLHYNNVREVFKDNSQVVLWQGDSGELLETILTSVDAPATFWLDAHYSGADTGMGSTQSPIIRELECIQKHSIKTHVILIDDVRQFGCYEFDYVTLDDIVKKILEINPHYTIQFLDCPFKAGDVLAAYVPSKTRKQRNLSTTRR